MVEMLFFLLAFCRADAVIVWLRIGARGARLASRLAIVPSGPSWSFRP